MKKLLLALTIGIIAIGISATPVYPPALISPTDGMIDQMPDVVLNWGAVAAALSYKVQVDKDPAFNSPDFSEYTTNLTATHAYQLSFKDTYYWRVKSFGSTDSSNWSQTWSFSIIDTVSLQNPTNNSGVKQMLDVRLRWHMLTGVSFYKYEADTVLTFDSPALQHGQVSDTTSYVRGDHLRFGAKYYWRVSAGHTSTNVSSWCQPWSFVTFSTFLLTGPADGSINRMPNVQLKWNKLTGINYYDYELSEDSLFSNPISVVTDTNVNYGDELRFGTKYYFRAMAINNNDISDWTIVRDFTTIEKVALVSPDNNSTNVSIRPMMTWDEITGITSFQLQYADNPAFINAFDDIFPATQTEYQVEGIGLDSATVYYWRVRAFHSKDTTDWSDVWNFKIAATGIDEVSFDKSDIQIYPNPASDKFFIDISLKQPMDIQVSIMDLLGQVMLDEEVHLNIGNNTREIKLQNLSNGIYLVKLQNGSEQYVSKIVIDK